MWSTILIHWNGLSMFYNDAISAPDMHLFTDASHIGFGGFFGSQWFSSTWPQEIRSLPPQLKSSPLLELYPSDALFIDSSRIVITRHWFASHLNTLLSRSWLSPQFYSPHSFWIGAATSAAHAGVNQHLIKTMWRWSSSAVEAYIRSSPTDIAAAHQPLVSMPGVGMPSQPGPPEVSSQ
ncbi:UNVERIFIED_CONTAM: hypothetical protein FKN15_073925 [Acipenser sinensis]